MLTQLSHNTGRVYNGEQVLEITLEVKTTDEFGLIMADATFTDKSRHIKGLIKDLVFFESDTPQAVGRYVLTAYDRCNYVTL